MALVGGGRGQNRNKWFYTKSFMSRPTKSLNQVVFLVLYEINQSTRLS